MLRARTWYRKFPLSLQEGGIRVDKLLRLHSEEAVISLSSPLDTAIFVPVYNEHPRWKRGCKAAIGWWVFVSLSGPNTLIAPATVKTYTYIDITDTDTSGHDGRLAIVCTGSGICWCSLSWFGDLEI